MRSRYVLSMVARLERIDRMIELAELQLSPEERLWAQQAFLDALAPCFEWDHKPIFLGPTEEPPPVKLVLWRSGTS